MTLPDNLISHRSSWLKATERLIEPDLIGWSPTGHLVSVGLKAPGGRVSKAQENWAALVRAGGGMALVVNQEGMLP